jgi:hypothetical protein
MKEDIGAIFKNSMTLRSGNSQGKRVRDSSINSCISENPREEDEQSSSSLT